MRNDVILSLIARQGPGFVRPLCLCTPPPTPPRRRIPNARRLRWNNDGGVNRGWGPQWCAGTVRRFSIGLPFRAEGNEKGAKRSRGNTPKSPNDDDSRKDGSPARHGHAIPMPPPPPTSPSSSPPSESTRDIHNDPTSSQTPSTTEPVREESPVNKERLIPSADPPVHEVPDSQLPSHREAQRWTSSKQLQEFMDRVMHKATLAGQHINNLTGTDYSGIAALRQEIKEQG